MDAGAPEVVIEGEDPFEGAFFRKCDEGGVGKIHGAVGVLGHQHITAPNRVR